MALQPKPYAEVLLEVGRANPSVFALDVDLKSGCALFAAEFPKRHVELGIAEQNAISAAAGLATAGMMPFVHVMAPFGTMRSFEQIRTDVGYPRRNVKIVASFGGLAGGPWHTTHHAIEDFALMRVIPGMTVIAPADGVELEKAVHAAARHDGPVYIRLPQKQSPPVYETAKPPAGFEPAGGWPAFELGKAVTLRPGNDVTLIATGSMVREALDAAVALARDGVDARVLNVHTIKPLDVEAVQRAACDTRGIVAAEEHSVIGGLGSAVAEVLAENLAKASEPSQGCRGLRRVGLQDTFCEVIGSAPELRARYGLTAAGIAAKAMDLIGAAKGVRLP
ncbi:MAG: transketolase family protein [Planctomycetes bacterium]|nr:transketolase family protein [Planctomycetota bacterium]